MSTDVVEKVDAMTQFRREMAERLKADVGNLIPNEVLEQITKEFLRDAFFKEREFESGNQYNRRKETKPPLAQEYVQEVLKEWIQASAREWASENATSLMDTMRREFEAECVKVFVRAVQDIASGQAREVGDQVIGELKNAGILSQY